jgi:ADP-ribose pyrophosphatase YjhB (NUDIX family)
MLRPLLHLYWRIVRGLTLGVRAVVIDGKGQVLLVRHGYTKGWHLPGGGVEPGETLRDALGRELMEEANVTLTGAPQLYGVFLNRHASRRDHVALYVVREFDWNGPLAPSLEIREANFFPLDRLPEGTTGGTRRRLKEVLADAEPNGVW